MTTFARYLGQQKSDQAAGQRPGCRNTAQVLRSIASEGEAIMEDRGISANLYGYSAHPTADPTASQHRGARRRSLNKWEDSDGYPMRLWSLHPSLLDPIGLVALWREALLAQKVLLGATKGYRHHPQLERFRQSRNSVRTIANYLWSVADEANKRGYHFDVSKIMMKRGKITIPVTRGQLAFELTHLKEKLRRRDPRQLALVEKRQRSKANPIFKTVEGPIALWERTPGPMHAKQATAVSTRRQAAIPDRTRTTLL